MKLTQLDIIHIPDPDIGETVVDEVFDELTAASFLRRHVLASRCEKFVARDAGDNLIVVSGGQYQYWDQETDRLIVLGADPTTFVIGREE